MQNISHTKREQHDAGDYIRGAILDTNIHGQCWKSGFVELYARIHATMCLHIPRQKERHSAFKTMKSSKTMFSVSPVRLVWCWFTQISFAFARIIDINELRIRFYRIHILKILFVRRRICLGMFWSVSLYMCENACVWCTILSPTHYEIHLVAYILFLLFHIVAHTKLSVSEWQQHRSFAVILHANCVRSNAAYCLLFKCDREGISAFRWMRNYTIHHTLVCFQRRYYTIHRLTEKLNHFYKSSIGCTVLFDIKYNWFLSH